VCSSDLDGDIIWVSFTVDGGNQPYSDVTLASELTVHGRVEYGYVREAPEDMTDDYTTPIDGFFANTVSIGQTLFFGFSQEAKAGQTFTYELLYKLESEMATIPTLFIKARVVTEGTGAETVINTPIGFNMSAFIATYKKADQGLVNFYIRYYQGTDAEGNELYTSPQSQPFNWILE
jgi:hypothetical protein